MPISFVKGDLFAGSGLDALAHGCNCAGAMGKGIALEFRGRFPRMYEEYRRRCAVGAFALGDVFEWSENGMTVFNLGTQATWKSKADLAAIERAVREMVRLAEAKRLSRVGLPHIGAGLGGLPWQRVRDLLVAIGMGTAVELVVFDRSGAR